MSTQELFDAFELDPTDHKAFEVMVKTAIEEDARDVLTEIAGRMPEWAADGETTRIFQILTQKARQHKEAEIGSFLNFHVGKLYWKTFGDERKAEMSFRKVKGAAPEPELLREFYLNFYTEQGNWRRLEQFLSGDMDDPVEVKRYLGRLAEEKGAPDKAVSFWQGVHRSAPNDEEANRVLRRLLTQVGKWHALVDLLRDGMKALPDSDPAAKVSILNEMIEIYRDKLNATPKVVESYKAILGVDPENREAIDALAAEYEKIARWPDLVKILQQKVAIESDPTAQIALYRRIAGIMMERFNNATEAIKNHRAILSIDPENPDAIGALKALYEERRQWEQYVEIAQHEIDLSDDPEVQRSGYLELAQLAAQRVRRPEVPIALWEKVISVDPTHEEALSQLEPLYERNKQFDRLADVLEKRVDAESEAKAKVALLEKLGMVYAVRMKDGNAATRIWRQVLETEPKHLKAQAELKKKYTADGDWENLEWFYRTYATVQEWVRSLESQAKSATDTAAKSRLLYQAAQVWKDELGEVRRAVRNLESIRDLNPNDASAAEMLIPIYRELSAWKKLPPVYDIVLDHVADRARRQTLLLEWADIYENQLSDPEAAYFRYVQALQESPAATELHEALRRLAETSGAWESYVDVLEDTGPELQDPADKVRVLLDIGAVYRDKLQFDEKARECFQSVVELDGENRVALEALELLYASAGLHESLIEILDRKLQIARDDAERKDTLFRLARAWRTELENPAEAEILLRRMLEEFPGDTHVHEELIDIFIAANRYADIRDQLEQKRTVLIEADAPLSQLADLECHLGMLAYGTSDEELRVSAAVGHYEQALSYEAGHEETRTRLEELVADEFEQLRIVDLLEPIYESSQNWSRLGDVLEIKLRHAENEGENGKQWNLLHRLAKIYRDETQDEALSWSTFARLFCLRPQVASNRAQLESATERLGRWEALVELYREYGDETSDAPARLAIHLAVARALQQRLQSPEEALVYYHKALDDEPGHTESLDALEGIYNDLSRPTDLLDIYRRKIDISDDIQTKLDYLFASSDLLQSELSEPEDAIGILREALGLQPGHLETHERLDTLFSVTEQYIDLAANLETMAELVSDDMERSIGYTLRLATVTEEHLSDVPQAIALYAGIFDKDADNSRAVASLERLFQDAEFAATIAPILQPFYERTGDWESLIGVYFAREDATPDPDEKVSWYYKIADLFESSGGDLSSAFDNYYQAATVDPGRQETIDHLLRLAQALENWEVLVEYLEALVEDIVDDTRRRETHRTIASLARERTRDERTAEVHLRAILELEPSDMPALDGLIALYREVENVESLVDMLLLKAPMRDDLEEKMNLTLEAGTLCRSVLQKPRKAIDIFEGLQHLNPDGTVAMDHLEDLYGEVQDWENLVIVYQTRIDRAEDLDTKKSYAGLMAGVQAGPQQAIDDAVGTWRLVLEWDEADLEALANLDDLYSQQEDWYNVLDILRKRQTLVEADEWVYLQFRVARLFDDEEQLADTHQAIDAYSQLLARDPQHEDTREALKYLIAEHDDREKAFSVLKPVLTQEGAFEELWVQYEVIVNFQEDDPFRQVTTLQAMAELAERDLNDAGRAFEALERALLIDLRNEKTIGELERVVAANSLYEPLVGLYQRAAEEADDDFLALGFHLKSGAMLMDRIDSPDRFERAIAVYRTAYDIDSDQAEVLERLHRLYETTEQYGKLRGILRNQAEVASDSPARIGFLLKLAQVVEFALEPSDTEAAYEALTEVLDLDAEHDDAIENLHRLATHGVHLLDIAERLEPIYQRREAHESLDTLWQLKLSGLDDALDRQSTMQQLADLHLHQLGSKPDAIYWLGEAFRISPEDDGILGNLEPLVAETEQHVAFLEILLDAAGACDDALRQVDLWLRAAAVCRDAIGEIDQAETIFRMVLDTDDENVAALKALDAIYVAAGRLEELEPILVREAAVAEYDEERVKLLVRLAELYLQVGERQDAISAYCDVLDLNDMHIPTLKALETIYRDDGAHESLFEILEKLANTAGNDSDRAGYTADMARLAQSTLNRPEAAVDLWEDVLMVSPQNVGAVQELQELLHELEKWEPLAEAYEREIRMEQADDERSLTLYRALGRLWQGVLEDGHQAQNHWEKARDVSPQFDAEIYEALRELYRENFVLEGLASTLVAQLESGTYEDSDQLILWRELAELRTDQLNDPSGAIEAWTVVLDFVPDDEPAIENLELLYERETRWADLVGLNRRKLGLEDDGETKVEILTAIANIHEQKLSDPAVMASTLEEVLELAADHEEAGYRLQQYYEGAEKWPQLADLLTRRDAVLEEPEDRLANLHRLAGIREEKLEDPAGAFEAYEVAAELVPDSTQTVSELGRLAEITDAWAEYVIIARGCAEHLEDDAALELVLKVASIYRDKLEAGEEAIEVYSMALERDEENTEALEALVQLTGALELWSDLVGYLELLADVSVDYAKKHELLSTAATVYEGELDNVAQAVKSWEAILDFQAADKEALEALERIHSEQGEWEALIAIYELASEADPTTEVANKLRIAGVYEEHLEDIDRAIEQYEEVLTYDRGNLKAIEALEGHYGERGDWTQLLVVYEGSADAAETDEERAEVCRKVAILHEALENPDSAAEYFQRVLELLPGDEEACEKLEAIFTASSRWEDLVEFYENRVHAATELPLRIDLLGRLALLQVEALSDVDSAIDAYQRILMEDGENAGALDALVTLYRGEELWDQVVDTLQRRLQGLGEDETDLQVELLCELGRIRTKELHDNFGAIEAYVEAMTQDPTCDAASEALIDLYTAEESFDKVVDVLNVKLQVAEGPTQSAVLHIRLASVLEDQLGEKELAEEHLEAANEADPEADTTLWPLSQHYVASENWTKAMPLLDMLIDKLEESEDETRLAQAYGSLGKCAEALLDVEKALENYQLAVERNPEDWASIHGLARMCYKREDWDNTRYFYQQLIASGEVGLEADALTEVYLHLGEASLKVGELDEATEFLDRVIANQPNNRGALERIVMALEAHGEWDAVIARKERLLELVEEDLDRFSIKMSIGDVYREKLGDITSAMAAYEEAMNYGSFSRAPMLQLVQIFSEQQNFEQASRVLDRLIGSEDDRAKRAQWAWIAGVMCRDELSDPAEAVKHFNQVLDDDLTKLEAFAAIEEILTPQKAWKPLEQNYRRMLQRVQKAGKDFERGPALLFQIYKNLGEIYRSRLKNTDYAISAFELAAKQRPKDVSLREILAELYEAEEATHNKAVNQYRALMKLKPEGMKYYHSLFELYLRMGSVDRAWCVAGLLMALGKANDKERNLYEEYRNPSIAEANRAFSQKLWFECVMGPAQDRCLGEIFSSVYQIGGKLLFSRTLKDLGVSKKSKVDLDEGLLFCNTLKTASKILGIPLPDVYLGAETQGMQILPTSPPALLVGQDMMQGHSIKDLAFHVAKWLTYFHPHHVLAAYFSREELDSFFLVARAIAEPGFDLAAALGQNATEEVVAQLENLLKELDKVATPPQRSALAQHMSQFLSQKQPQGIGQWHRQVELTADHAGLIIADDVATVGRIIREEVSGLSKLTPQDKLKDLIDFASSNRYALLRRGLGLSVDAE